MFRYNLITKCSTTDRLHHTTPFLYEYTNTTLTRLCPNEKGYKTWYWWPSYGKPTEAAYKAMRKSSNTVLKECYRQLEKKQRHSEKRPQTALEKPQEDPREHKNI